MIDLHDCVAQKLDPLGWERGPQANVVVAKMAKMTSKEGREVNKTDILLLLTKAPPH